jgi:hypothetical protein
MSLREISGRDLLGDSFNNKSGVLQNIHTARQEPQPSFTSQIQELSIPPRKRWLILTAIGLPVLIGGLSLVNEIAYNVFGKINRI